MNIDPASYQGASDFNLFSNEGVLTPSSFLDFASVMDVNGSCESQTHNRRPSSGRRISGGIVDRVAQFEQMALKSPQRPRTPTRKNVSGNFSQFRVRTVTNQSRLLPLDSGRDPSAANDQTGTNES
jgi:regulatory protein SWI5